MSNAGYIAHPTLDGIQLVGVSPVDFEVSENQGISVQRLATGHYRKTAHFVAAKYPDVQIIYSWRIDYTKLTVDVDEVYLDFVTWAISRPGLHTFTNWKFARLTWTVAQNQTEFFLPWRVANYFVSFPAEDPTGVRLLPRVTTDPINPASVLTVVEKTTAEYDVETPSAGEAFIDTEGTRFKVGDTLIAGTVLYAKFIPLHSVLLEQEIGRRLITGKEGRVLLIQEI